MHIRKLGPEDAHIWRQIRLEGLKTYPSAFLTQYEDAAQRPISDLADQLSSSRTFVAFDDEALIGSMVCIPDNGPAVAHRAKLVAVYVRETWQGHGVAEALLQAVLDDLPDTVLQVELEVAATNPRARAFYERQGFRVVGTMPRAVLRDGVATDDHIMVRLLDA
ncbi:GNAT family N-acetyltransferase [Halovulum sp. GXIMD14793]